MATQREGYTYDELKDADYAEVVVDLPADVRETVRACVRRDEENTDPAVFDGKCYETRPHVTIALKLDPRSPKAATVAAVEALPFRGVDVLVAEPGVFRNATHDVVHLAVACGKDEPIRRLHAAVHEAEGAKWPYSAVRLHVTLAYVKPGKGDAVAERLSPLVRDLRLHVDRVVFRPFSDARATADNTTAVRIGIP